MVKFDKIFVIFGTASSYTYIGRERVVMDKIKLLSTLLIMYILTGLLLLVMAFLLYKFQLGESFVSVGIVVVYVVAGFVGGRILGARLKAPCGLWGLILGSIYFCILFLGSAILGHGLPEDGLRMLAVWIMCGCGGMLGGMLVRRSNT